MRICRGYCYICRVLQFPQARWYRALAYLVPSVLGAAIASLAVGLVDGLQHTASALQVAVATGFISLVGIPVGIVLGLLARILWSTWDLRGLGERVTEETGGCPRLAAWVGYAVASLWLVAAVCFNAVRALGRRSGVDVVVALGSAIAVTAAVAVLIALSRPLVDSWARVVRVIDRAIFARFSRSLFTPGWIFGQTAVCVTALVITLWVVSIRPRIGYLDVDPYLYLLGFASLVLIAQPAWRAGARWRRLRTAFALSIVVVDIAAVATAIYVRHRQPFAMLEVRGDTVLAGAAIDRIYNVQLLRRDFHMSEFRPEEKPGAQHPDVVLITVDTLRADRTPPYDRAKQGLSNMPNLRRFAAEAAVFDWAFSPSNNTRRSLPAIVTGSSPFRIRGRVAGWALRLDPRHVMLAERFRAAGYDTAGFLAPPSQFSPGHQLGLIRGIDHLVVGGHSRAEDDGWLAQEAKKWLVERAAKRPDKPLFLWIHFIDPHRWDNRYPAKKYGSELLGRYDRALAAVDDHIGTVLEAVWNGDSKERTIVALTSDHGEGLGDKGHRFHATSLYNSQIRVPLMIAGAVRGGRRIQRAVGLVDLAPTLLDLAGFVPPGLPDMDGSSLAEVIQGTSRDGPEAGEAYSVMIKDRSVKRTARALIAGRYKLIEHSSRKKDELYDLRADPRERHDLRKKKPEVLKRLKDQLRTRRAIDSISPF